MISIAIEKETGEQTLLEVPVDMGLNLMEVLKAYEYDILATCGGMALCATCHIEVLEGSEKIPPVSDAELDILDTMPATSERSRLACQLRPDEGMDGLVIRLGTFDEN
ncbi:2Fe-2S iron-sulfur cluster-binding protein [Dyadobacter tibetensis]|uniref:2Fe-2S iron-sulfur cluster-binding protein n=1 Tax=Dyadobacter tibetensis TaxID=1211851 RepID=UPI0004717F15|nr:2Fe-2S iron-sulfur cluster-binding protein [Dyadobacter tibetensis]